MAESAALGDRALRRGRDHLGHSLLELSLGHVRVEVAQRPEEGAAEDHGVPRVAPTGTRRQRGAGAVLPFAVGEGVKDALLGPSFAPTVSLASPPGESGARR